jgi:hypothetical protein
LIGLKKWYGEYSAMAQFGGVCRTLWKLTGFCAEIYNVHWLRVYYGPTHYKTAR